MDIDCVVISSFEHDGVIYGLNEQLRLTNTVAEKLKKRGLVEFVGGPGAPLPTAGARTGDGLKPPGKSQPADGKSAPSSQAGPRSRRTRSKRSTGGGSKRGRKKAAAS